MCDTARRADSLFGMDVSRRRVTARLFGASRRYLAKRVFLCQDFPDTKQK